MGLAGISRLILGSIAAVAFAVMNIGSPRAQTNVPDHSLSLTVDGNSGMLLTEPAGGTSFHMNFLLDDSRRMGRAQIGTTHDLEISLTSPNTPVFHFLFSPRPQFGIGYDPLSGTNRAYGGLTWDLFSTGPIFGNFGLASTFDPGIGGIDRRHLDEAPLMFHSAVEFGYRIDQQNSVRFAIDQGLAPGWRGSGPEAVDNFMLRYGTKF